MTWEMTNLVCAADIGELTLELGVARTTTAEQVIVICITILYRCELVRIVAENRSLARQEVIRGGLRGRVLDIRLGCCSSH